MTRSSIDIAHDQIVADLEDIKSGIKPTSNPRVWVHPTHGKIVLTDDDVAEIEFNIQQSKKVGYTFDTAKHIAETKMMNRNHSNNSEIDSQESSGGFGVIGTSVIILLIVVLFLILGKG